MQAEKQYLEVDAGPRRQAGPDRLCIATRSVRPVDDLIRFVAGPDGLVPDLKRRLPGRGVWVTARRQTVLEAVRRGAFKRSLKSDVRVPADLPDLVDRLMHRAALDALAIAQKAAEVVCGFAKTEAAIGRSEVSALLHASEASRDGLAKLAAAVKRRHGGMADNLPRIHSFSSADLDLALGRANVVHAALLAGRAGETFLTRWRELERFRNAEAAVEGGPGQTNDETDAQTVAPRELGLE